MQRKYNVFITRSAQNDISEIYEYIASDSTKNAKIFISEIEKKITGLKNFPERNPLLQENEYFNTTYRHLLFKDYRIIYRVENINVFILRVYHGRRLLSELNE
ncbi:MAG: type II toxin-antitoxin system RelE/ParE family toxin [bacterium]